MITYSLYSQEKLGLNDAIKIALENNYDIQITEAEKKVAEINNSWGTAGRYPALDFSINSNNRWDYNENSNYDQNITSGGVVLNWLLFDGFAVKIRKDRLDYYEKLSAGHAAVVIEGTVEAVILGYYQILLEKEKLQVAETLMNLSKDRFDYEQERQRIGSLTTYDLLQAQNSWLEDKGRFLIQQVNFKNSIRDLNYLMAVDVEKSFDFTEKFQPQLKSYDLSILKEKLLSNNQTLHNQYIAQSLLEKQVALSQSDWYPALSFRGGYDNVRNQMNFQGTERSTSTSFDYYANVTLSWNIFDGGNRKRAVEIAKIDEETGQIEIDNMKHSLTNSLYNLYEIFLVRQELLNVAREALETAELNLQISAEKFKNGAINSFNYRDVQLIYLNAAVSRLDAIYNYINVDTALLRIIGGILNNYK